MGAIGEIVGAVAVVVTLLYLSRQIRQANRQGEIEAFRHTWDNLNQFCDILGESTERAELVLRGREDLGSLGAEEALVFEHIHLRLLNTLESWHLQIQRTSRPGEYRDGQLRNLSGIAEGYLGFAGTRELWTRLRPYFEPIQALVDEALAETGPGRTSSAQTIPGEHAAGPPTLGS
ncbi:MAG: hypothetical protein ACF8NJ_11075 [Phycisphaerales bacterium JB038]